MIATEKNVLRISFFENIYYSFWFYLRKILPEDEANLAVPASILSLFCKVVNVLSIISIVSWLIGVNLVKAFFESFGGDVSFAILIALALFVIYVDDVFFLRRFHAIKYKYRSLSIDDSKKMLRFSVTYLLVTLILGLMIPVLLM